MRLRVIERLVVGSGRQNEQVGASAAAAEQIVRHGKPEQFVVISLDDEDWEAAVAEGFFS